ncbi:MAG: MOSC domain-containing protein [Parcubacteria group bacterium Gr01-1014_48]|nr:MAG: MOSC domain-containing protein [Parcubacteria group bacterium Greene0416_14]TSC72804.1 MAG: MOSC domain-containing protein [Parcubacteria group bacterium Gr01-1014_48]TSD00908.1 MAG: MOSC domain-containing protein [Parcubacteria group bacterium Greene1014_15]TSD07990.1 MAG: MOSC domain-containing protein [Parcubacteria group bacterium Greene0714_4]
MMKCGLDAEVLIKAQERKERLRIMAHGKVVAICICPVAGGEMQLVNTVEAVAGAGLRGDRYCTAEGSFNKGSLGRRQVTLINGRFFKDSGFEYADSRRNIVTIGVELMWLIGRDFEIGMARMRGVKYCDPCNRPSKLSGNKKSFMEMFFDCGGLVAEIIESGVIMTGDLIIPPSRGY